MSEWKKLNSRDVYVIVAEDISDSLQRYFAPEARSAAGYS
jgi:hypothetical protein